ncbi:MAG: adenylate/guanylate cyclase domain-containing protein [Alphaproteobacteria bacterium]|nr:adenylate/guanylate cyclase domain-containing protein [Alphaproteobacteria bacterium]
MTETTLPDPTASQRRLAAILTADVAGWSLLMGQDEEGTLARLKLLRRDLIDVEIARYRGRIVKTVGDGVLVEFPSVVDALRSALAMQGGMAERNRNEPECSRISFRVGINLGDVVVDNGDIFGDGVNIAARLQALAEPGGICVSQSVVNHARGKVAFVAIDAGEQMLKNIAQPVHVWRIAPPADPTRAAEPATPEAAVKPAIAVLPFVNMSGDPEQEFFADGLTEDILTELSRFRELLVISRNSVFVYKRKPVNVQAVARELSVHYVVEGSVRRAGNRVRVTVQLIEAAGDRHLWAERYDRELKDIFEIQDEITRAIVAVLPGRIEAAARERVKRKTTDNMAAYELVLAGKLLHHRSNRADNAEALRLLDRAITLDPGYAHARAWKACTLGQAWVYSWCEDRDAAGAALTQELHTAQALDDNDSDVHRILAAKTLAIDHDYDRALYHQSRALALNPNDDLIVVQQGEILTWLGRAEEGIEWILRAMRLNPYHPERFWGHLGRARFVARRYAEAVEAFGRVTRPDFTQLAFLAPAHAALDEAAAAAARAEEVRRLVPDFAADAFLETQHYRQAEDRDHHRALLIRAGLG